MNDAPQKRAIGGPSPRAGHVIFLWDRCRAYDSATRSLSGVIIRPGIGDSGYTANSIAFSNHNNTVSIAEVNLPTLNPCLRSNFANLRWDVIPF
jgi:hypothetical protein